MPVFGSSRSEQPTEAELRATEVDLERIRQGGVPLRAELRLKRLAMAGTPFFTSDLSAKEYALAADSGLQPIAQVMGSSVVQHGATGGQGAIYRAGEIPSFSKPLNMARDRAFDRLTQEAQFAGADGVIGIEVTAGSAAGAGNLETVVIGTAVRDNQWPGRDPARLAMCTLSGQDVDKLRRIGAAVCGVVGYSTVWSVLLAGVSYRAIAPTGPLGRPSLFNQELPEITEGVAAARRRVMLEVHRLGDVVGADSIVISSLEHTVKEISEGYFHVTMNVLGTAIRLGAHDPRPTPFATPRLSIKLGDQSRDSER